MINKSKIRMIIGNAKANAHHAEYTVKKLFFKELKTELDRNREFQNLHKGERCFIIGNGPSTKVQDLSLLKNEYVFCVNQCTRNTQFSQIDANYYVCIDHNFFNIDIGIEEDKELLDTFRRLGDCAGLKCFFPFDIKTSFIKKHRIDSLMDVHYIQQGMNICEGFNANIDLSNAIPYFGTVVQTAIAIAIYMGFSEIYLLGCDETGIVVTINSILKRNNQEYYSYHVSENEHKRMETMVEHSGLEQYSRAYYHAILGFRLLYEYCLSRGIKLVNCSAESVIDSIPKVKYEDILGVK